MDTSINLFEFHFEDKIKRTNAHGYLFMNDRGKLEFKGDVEESARVFFEEYLKPMCEKYIKELTEN